jgi:DNA repair protein RadD
MLRDYQQEAVNQVWDYMRNNKGNPCLEMPTGSGKSWVIAAICQDALKYPGTRILMLTHVRELIAQNLEKLLSLWPGAPVGVYAAGLKRKESGCPITYGSVQTIQRNIEAVGEQDLIVIDECHRISHKNEGGYINIIEQINPNRVIGLTASPYRLGHGYITDGDAIFDEIIKPVSIEEMVERGYLAPLRNKATQHKISTDGVKKRGGEFIEGDLQRAVNTSHNNVSSVEETIRRASDRKSWLFFCTGVDHANEVKELLIERGIKAETITGKTPTCERDDIIARFKAGEIRALTNANVLTTGFDYPDIDCVVFLRPTMSAALYVQMAGRGMRPKSHAKDCLVLDFAGLVLEHGPITAIRPKKPKGKGEAPIKQCENCGEVVALSTKICPDCGAEFVSEEKPEKEYILNDRIDIMGEDKEDPQMFEFDVDKIDFRKHIAKSGIPSLKVTYWGGYSKVVEYLCINHKGYAGEKAGRILLRMCINSGAEINSFEAPEDEEKHTDTLATWLNCNVSPPSKIYYRMNGKYENIIKREWDEQSDTDNRMAG